MLVWGRVMGPKKKSSRSRIFLKEIRTKWSSNGASPFIPSSKTSNQTWKHPWTDHLKKKTWNTSCKHPCFFFRLFCLCPQLGQWIHVDEFSIATGLLAKSATDKEPLSSKLSSTSCASNCKYCWENLAQWVNFKTCNFEPFENRAEERFKIKKINQF